LQKWLFADQENLHFAFLKNGKFILMPGAINFNVNDEKKI
jgi:hypothetical protein